MHTTISVSYTHLGFVGKLRCGRKNRKRKIVGKKIASENPRRKNREFPDYKKIGLDLDFLFQMSHSLLWEFPF